MLCDSNGIQLDARKIWVGLKNHYVDYCERSLTRSEEAMANLQYDPRKGVEELYNTMTSLRHKIAAANIFWGEKVFASRVMAKLVSKSREWRYFEGHTVRWTDEMLSPNKFLSELIEEEIKLINMGALPRHGVDDTIYEANYASRNHRNLRKGSTSHGPNAHGAKQGNSSRDDYFAANHEMDNYYRREQGRRPYEQRNDDQDRMPACHNCGNIGHYAKDCRPAPRNSNYRQSSPKFFSKGPRSNNQDRSRNNQSADGMFVAMDDKKRDIVIDEACSSIDRSDMFILDSGASSHMVCRPEWVYDFVPCSNRQVKASGQDMHNVIGTGTVEILCNVGHRTVSIQLGNVLVVPTFGVNLISENILEDKGCRISIFKKVRTIRKSNGEVIMTTRRDGGVNAVNCEAIISDEERAMAHATVIATANHASEVFRKPTDTAGWHKRLGHINVEAIKNLADKSEGLDIIPGKTKERSQCGAPLFTHSYNLRGGVTPSVPIVIDNVVSPKTSETPGNPDCASTPIGGESEPGRRQVPRVVPTARNTARMTVADRGTEVTTSDERITQEELLGRGISRNKAIKTSLNESSLAGYRKPNQKPRSKSQGSRKAVQERPVDVMNRDRATMAAPTESTVTADYPGAISEVDDASEPSIQAAVEQRMVEDLPTNTSQDDSDLEESDQYYSYTHGSGTSNADESNNTVAVISDGSSRNIVPETWQQAMMSSDADLWNAVKLVLHYVQGTLSYALELGGTNASLSGYSDADWAGDVKTRKSTSGYLCYVGNALVSWRSSKQTCVAVSTMEAEYTAAESASRELLFLRDLLGELGFEQDGPTTLYCDSQSAISNMIGPSVVHEATKHIGIKINALRDRISQGLIKPEYIGTKDQVADILTKGLPRPAFEQFVNLLGLRECSRRGGVLDIGNV
ncbi:hypothetical protein BDEG_28558 [Batrachochytrium dendrobatidis JEL423]|uniref:CCHC-type domain-containing protein n=1 Tax=Batrachochytrium dendrobatidis (strain JEL423) TaxID=403673 RepID=A0A177WZB8_BATDL|nr:hypothetical protein BDEG_28558 [Batrachochytrium dendrobatidis JEL423]